MDIISLAFFVPAMAVPTTEAHTTHTEVSARLLQVQDSAGSSTATTGFRKGPLAKARLRAVGKSITILSRLPRAA